MLSKNQKLIFVAASALFLHLLFFDYRFGFWPNSDIGVVHLGSFRILGIYKLGVHVAYNMEALYFFRGAFIPQLFGIGIPMAILLFVSFATYNKIKANLADKKERHE